jgi:hypothetical protein
MRGQVSCRFIGGPKADETLTVSLWHATIQLQSPVMRVAQGRNGQMQIMKGPIPARAPWVTYARDVYEKIKPSEPGNVTYRFVRTEEVTRCEKVFEGKNRRCRNEAGPGGFCKVHSAAL